MARRSSREIPKPSYKESDNENDNDNDNDDEVVVMDVDDSDEDAAMDVEIEDDVEDADIDDDDDASSFDSAPIRSMVRRQRRQKPLPTQATASRRSSSSRGGDPSSSSSAPSRRPSRAARFQGSMKEPPSDSVRDLFQGSTTHPRLGTTPAASTTVARKANKASGSGEEVDNNKDGDEDLDDRSEEQRVVRKDRRRSTSTTSKKPRRLTSPAKIHARRHTRPRKSVKEDEASSEDESEDEQDDDDDDQGSEEELRIHRILASRTEARAKWREIGAGMNSSEVTCGSVWNQPERETKGTVLFENEDVRVEERFLVKWAGLGYLHVSWETQTDLLDQIPHAKKYLSTFFRKAQNGILLSQDDRKDGDFFDPGYTQIDRILEVFFERDHPSTWEEELQTTNATFHIVLDTRDTDRFEEGTGRQFLIKWEGMNYSECTYEFERDLILADVEYKARLKEYYQRSRKTSNKEWKALTQDAERAMRESYKLFGDKAQTNSDAREAAVKKYQEDLAKHVFRNGGQLRDYQAEGVAWFLANFVNHRSCIMADEMGLGKTLQTAAFVHLLVNRLHRPGPYLVVVPLSTISHWQREFINWTGLNTIVYHGSAEDRSNIRQHEFAYMKDRPDSIGANTIYLNKCAPAKKGGGPWMATVVICTPEMLTAEDSNELAAVNWEVLVVDEAHRLKNHNSKLATTLRKNLFSFNHKVLLTGTPIQNDMKEFWTLLNFIDPKEFPSMETFLEEYGSIKSKEKIDQMHQCIRPYILRRLKEDVEKSVPPKEETLIEVELTVQQKQYYRALYEKNVGFLQKNKKRALDGPSLNNLAMQLRKCCNHLFLLNGVEVEIRKQKENLNLPEADLLARGSGKLVLLDKLLPRLKENGHRILIFSQFKIMLDVLEDYLEAKQLKFERIDGSITGHRRQAAIDRFQDPSSKDPPFVMLLSTRAGGVGINLTSADTCIIFDSDWNPQNDLQAQARCHRIGQTKNVKVYRLLSRKSYEMQMFHMSSLKMGLDQAVLKGFESGSTAEGTMTKEEVERLLRHGAYDIFNEEKTGTAEAESNAFVQQDIDSILERRATRVVHGNTGSGSKAVGGTFSKASFVAPNTPSGNKDHQKEDVDIEDPDFWKKMVGESKDEAEPVLKPRKRKQAIYSEKYFKRQLNDMIVLDPSGSDGSDSDSYESDGSDDDSDDGATERARWGGSKQSHWKKSQAAVVLECLERFGYGVVPWEDFRKAILPDCEKFEDVEIRRMGWAVTLLSICEVTKEEVVASTKRAERLADKKKDEQRNGDILGVPMARTGAAVVNAAQQYQLCFKRLWSTHAKWASRVLIDAVTYAREHEPRSVDSDEDQGAEISRAFFSTLWEPLQGRGWKVEDTEDGKVFHFGNQKFDSPSAVMNEAVRIHPELSNMVLPMLNTLEERRLSASNKVQESRERELSLADANVDYESLMNFLLRYAPLQLLGEKRQMKRLPLGRRLLTSCKHMYEASFLVEKATKEGIQLKAILSVDPRSTLPHPLWTFEHDAILVHAIVKHGWVDREKACRRIVKDTSINWGAPFQLDREGNDKTKNSGDEQGDLRTVAQRAAVFMATAEELLDVMKGVNRHLIIEAYGLRRFGENGDQGPGTWSVDDELLLTGSKNNTADLKSEGVVDLPTKKELAKRATLVLSKSVLVAEGGGRASAGKSGSSIPSKEVVDHGFTAVDQGNRCCILLAEMIRGVCKASLTKAEKSAKFLCSLVFDEAQTLRDMYASKTSQVDRQRATELASIVDQIQLARRSMKCSTTPGKNLFRAMLGIDPAQPKIASDPVYPSYASLDLYPPYPSRDTTASGTAAAAVNAPAAVVKPKKEIVIKKEEGTTGEKAILRSLKKAIDLSKDGVPKLFSPEDEPEVGLQLTMTETLMLHVFCTEGIPLSGASSGITRNGSKDWQSLFNILKIFVKESLEESKEKLSTLVEKLDVETKDKSKIDLAKRIVSVEWEIAMATSALKQLTQMIPQGLAIKSIMLLEKVRHFAFFHVQTQLKTAHKYENYLGPKIINWIAKEIAAIGVELNVPSQNGRPTAASFTDVLSACPEQSKEEKVAAYMTKASCRQVISQIALLSRLRSLFSMNDDATLRDFLLDAIKKCNRLGDVWENRPAWWAENQGEGDRSFTLLQALNIRGFSGVLAVKATFDSGSEDGHKDLKRLGLTKPLIQQRANQLVREMHANDETAHTFRKLEERRNRGSSKKQGYDRSLAECHTAKLSSSTTNGGFQTGISAFFTSSKSEEKIQASKSMKDDTVKSVLETTGKRKGSPTASDAETSPSEKMPKKLAPIFVVAAKSTNESIANLSSDNEVNVETSGKQ